MYFCLPFTHNIIIKIIKQYCYTDLENKEDEPTHLGLSFKISYKFYSLSCETTKMSQLNEANCLIHKIKNYFKILLFLYCVVSYRYL